MSDLIQKLEIAVLRRNPLLAEKLQPGLSAERIRKILKKARISGATDPIVEIYSWRNGTMLDMDLRASKSGFVPKVVYQFTELTRAISDLQGFKEAATYHPKLSILVDRYFPFLWDGSNCWIALDIDLDGEGRVVTVQDQEEEPLREGYRSFVEFLNDVIQSNESDKPLACIRNPGKPISKSQTREPLKTNKRIFIGDKIYLIRTDFSNDPAWNSFHKVIRGMNDEPGLILEFVNELKYKGFTARELPSVFPENEAVSFAFIIDRIALTGADHAVLAVDLRDKSQLEFRVVPSLLQNIANNLSAANMSFDEFAKAVDRDGVFRGFHGEE